MKMRTIKLSSLCLPVLVLTVGAIVNCASLPDDCDTHRNCPIGGTAGSSGSSGDAGEGNANVGGSVAGKGGSAASGSTSGGKSGSGGSSGTSSGGDGGAGGTGGSCDTTKSPTEEACLVTDDYAVFVSPDGDDDANDGSQGAPLASLTKAVEVAAGAKLVLVCDATYDEHAVVTVGARVYGGFKCTDWTAEDGKPLFKPTTTGPALKIDSVDDEVLLQGVSFEVGDAVNAGETALAAIVNQSPKVTFRSVSLKAGKGKTGANGALTMFTYPAADALNGNPENPATMGGAEKICSCQTALMSVGGLGGPPSSAGTAGSKGLPDHGAGVAGTPVSCGSGGTGQDGNDAPAPSPASGAKTLGDATPTGWNATGGVDGATGSPGQGGGGGASRNNLGHGGGGGCGGCGGNGGTAGKGGGGSIALLAVGSQVALDASSLVTADAGNGGSGASGQSGQPQVGVGGGTVSALNSCPGGVGGKGGDGAAGGGGAGGISAGIVWKGAMQPTVSADTTITTGKAGVKGNGGVPATNDGIAGVSQKILAAN